jgi:DNA-binding MarR family transcriptional regulator
MPPVPIARLLAAVTRKAIDELNAELARRGFDGVRPAHGYALNAVRDGTTTSQLARRLGMTKQGAAKLVETLVREGYLARAAHDADSRATLLTLTSRGRALLRAAERIQSDFEARWDAPGLRDALERIAGDDDAPLRPAW